MCKDTKNKSDKDCINKIIQLEKERKPIMYIEIRHESFNNINNIDKNVQVLKKYIFLS